MDWTGQGKTVPPATLSPNGNVPATVHWGIPQCPLPTPQPTLHSTTSHCEEDAFEGGLTRPLEKVWMLGALYSTRAHEDEG